MSISMRLRRVILSASSPMNIVVLRPLLDVLQRDARIELFLAGLYQGQDNPLAIARKAGLSGVHLLSKCEAYRLKADLYLTPDHMKMSGKARRKALMFHGVSFKGRSISPKVTRFDKILMVGPYQRRKFIEAGILTQDDPRIEMVGMPKLDQLLNGRIDRARARARLGVDDGTPLVLYAPTWTEQSSLYTMGEAMLDQLAGMANVRVVVKLHDHLYDPSRNTVDVDRASDGVRLGGRVRGVGRVVGRRELRSARQ